MVLSVECRTCDQEVVGLSHSWVYGVKTLGKFSTHERCLRHPAV